MSKTSNPTIYRLAIIFFMLLIISTCMVGGTFAALSATYVWHSDTVNSGDFVFADSTYDISLFGKSEIFPGDFGQSILGGKDFDDNIVTWSFSETNLDSMPIIYYILNTDSQPVGIYSKYDFATLHGGLFTKISDKTFLSTSDISSSPKAIAKELSVGATLHWLWADNLYAKSADGAYAIDESASTKEYTARNAQLCSSTYSYTGNPLAFFKDTESKMQYFASSQATNGFNFISLETEKLSLNGDYISHDNKPLPIFVNGNIASSISNKLTARDNYYVFVAESVLGTFKTTASNYSINYNISDEKYARTSASMTVDADGKYHCIKIFPDCISKSATVQVSIAASVTKK